MTQEQQPSRSHGEQTASTTIELGGEEIHERADRLILDRVSVLINRSYHNGQLLWCFDHGTDVFNGCIDREDGEVVIS